MTSLTFREPRILLLLIGLIIAVGVTFLQSIARQEDPTITNLFATILTPFPGADSARVEALVTEKIEAELQKLDAIDDIRSTSRTGISVISVELSAFLPDADIPAIWSEIRDSLDDAALEFPPGVPRPVFDNDRTGAYTLITAIRPAPGASVSNGTLKRYAQALQDRLRGVPQTKIVELFGDSTEEIRVTVPAATLASLGLRVGDVAQALEAADSKVAAGQVRGPTNDLLVEVAGELDALGRIRDVPLRTNDDGASLRVGDIATVERMTRTPPDAVALADGVQSVLVASRMEDDRQVDVWAERARATIDEFAATLPIGVEHDILFDQSSYTADRFATLLSNIALGVGLVVSVLFLTLGWRAALVVAMILPLTGMLSLAVLQILGVTLHQMSITGLIVALGLLVDAAIVMTDEVRRRIASGLDRAVAVGASVRLLAVPLLASTATTMLAFMPMALLPGPAGDFVGAIATAVIVMLGSSFVLALLVTPALAGLILTATERGQGIAPGRLGRWFEHTIDLALRYPGRSIAAAVVLPIMGFLAFPTLTAQFFPGVERDQFHVQLRLPPSASLAASQRAAAEADAVLKADPAVERVHWVIGESAPAFYYNMKMDQDGAARFAEALVFTTSEEATQGAVPRLQIELDRLVPQAQTLVRYLVQGPPVDAPVEIDLQGPELTVLQRLGADLRRTMAEVSSITHTYMTIDAGAPKVLFRLDETDLRRTGLAMGDVASQLNDALEGAVGGSLIEGSEELPVRVRLEETMQRSASSVGDLDIVPAEPDASNYSGVPLSALGAFELVADDPPITRRNGVRVNTVRGYVAYGVLPEEALQAVLDRLETTGFDLPAGYRLVVGGDADARNETTGNLAASLGLILALTVATIVLTFRSYRLSLITGAVSVLSVGLSLLVLAVLNYPFGIQALIGVIGSVGVSINAAIIVLTALRDSEASNSGDVAAMRDVVVRSSRHILSTTTTTFGGFLPLLLAGGGFWPPFAAAIAGGVLLSTILAFYFTPPMFRLTFAKRARKSRPELVFEAA